MSDKKKQSGNEQLEKLVELFDSYIDTVDAIMVDYVLNEPGAVTELDAANNGFRREVESLQLPETLDAALGILTQLDESYDGLEHSVVLDHIDKMDAEALKWHLACEGYAVIKLSSLEQREKLEAFIKSEIWPFHNESDNYEIPY